MANKETHTVRTISRRTIGGDSDFLGRRKAARENKKTLFRRMAAVVVLVTALLGALAMVETFSKRTVENRPQTPSIKTDTPPPLPTVNLDNLEDALKREKAPAEDSSVLLPAASETVEPPAELPAAQSPARTPFDDFNYVETPQESQESSPVLESLPQSENNNLPQVEQRLTETGETILKITPKKAQPASPESPILKPAEPLIESPKTALPKPVLEKTEPLPMESAKEYALPQSARMPPNRYHVQAGIFLENARARALYQKILNAGIPAVMETRVQVGPFLTRKEAENAQKRLKELGVESIVVSPNL